MEAYPDGRGFRARSRVDELLALRGLHAKRGGQGRRGGARREAEQRTAMFTALAHVQNLWLDMSALEVYDHPRRRTPSREVIQSPLNSNGQAKIFLT